MNQVTLTIVNVIQAGVRILRIVDDEWAAQAIAVLSRQVTVIPEGT